MDTFFLMVLGVVLVAALASTVVRGVRSTFVIAGLCLLVCADRVSAEQTESKPGATNAVKMGTSKTNQILFEYDRKLVRLIRDRWHAFLPNLKTVNDHKGKVVLKFKLNQEGRVSDMKIISSDMSDLQTYVCLSAIQDSSPFGPWSPGLKLSIHSPFREVTFTFYYE